MAEYYSGIQYVDKYISDDAMTVLEILQRLQEVHSLDVRDRIIFKFEGRFNLSSVPGFVFNFEGMFDGGEILGGGEIIYENHKNFRVDVDDISQDIVHFLSDIEKNIFDIVIGEFIKEENGKRAEFRYETFAKCYFWDESKNFEKLRDQNYIQIRVDSELWKGFNNIRKRRGMKLEDIFKIALIRFLEKRIDFAVREIDSSFHVTERNRATESGIFHWLI